MEKFEEKSYHALYFFLWPFFTLIFYLKNFRRPHAKNVMWLFTVFYAFTFAIGRESQESDIVSYMADVPLLHNLKLNFSGLIAHYQSLGEIDILRTVLAYLVSLFTANGYYLIIVYGIIFGYFYSRNMWYILDQLKGKTKFFTRVLLFCLFLIIPIWNLNGFRFWTASHIFLYGLLPYFFEGKKKSLIWCFLTPFVVHYSFLFALIPLGIYLIFGSKVKFYYAFFIISLFMSSININQFNNVIETYSPKILSDRSSSYRNEDKVEALRDGSLIAADSVWYERYYGLSVKYSLTALLLVLFWVSRITIKKNKVLLKMFSFILLFYGFANIISTIPSGERFVSVANLLTFSFLVIYFQNYIVNKKFFTLSKITTPFLVFFIVIAARMGLYSLSIMSIIGNPIIAIFAFGKNIALNDIIKGL